jgi:hypothetical protein
LVTADVALREARQDGFEIIHILGAIVAIASGRQRTSKAGATGAGSTLWELLSPR